MQISQHWRLSPFRTGLSLGWLRVIRAEIPVLQEKLENVLELNDGTQAKSLEEIQVEIDQKLAFYERGLSISKLAEGVRRRNSQYESSTHDLNRI